MTKRNPLPSYEKVRELFDYDPRTGLLYWRKARSNIKAGSVAGAKRGDEGYLQVSIDNKLYRVHLIIWVWMTGFEPTLMIDHENTIKSDNRWINLREATKSQNMANNGPLKNNRSGVKGVYWYAAYGKWVSQFVKDGKAYFVGYFDSLDKATAAHEKKYREVYGEFARTA